MRKGIREAVRGTTRLGVGGRRNRRTRVGLLAVMAMVLAAAACGTSPFPTTPPTSPTQPTSGLGSDTPCTVGAAVAGTAESGQTTAFYYPGGTAASPLTGGNCGDSSRPVVAVVHGLDAENPTLYQGIINHEVAVGNIVIFATYNTAESTLLLSFQDEDKELVSGASQLTRDDLSRFGIIGHSMGAGASAYLTLQAASRHWGSNSLWVFALAPWYVNGVGTGPINFPSNARVIIENYDNDVFVDARIGIDYFNSLPLPPTQKVHVEVQSETRGSVTLGASHLTPNEIIAPDDSLKYFGIYRDADVLQGCSITNTWCNWSQMTDMGTWSDGQAATPAIVSQSPTDMGPSSLAECNVSANDRSANCGTSVITTPA